MTCYVCGTVRVPVGLNRWRKLIHDEAGNLTGVDMNFCAQSLGCIAFADADRLGRLTAEQVGDQRERERQRARREAQALLRTQTEQERLHAMVGEALR